MSGRADVPVAVVTGGGGGIGAAIATELGRRGVFVVTVDPLVSVDGSERMTPTETTTAERIVAAGGRARASSVSVTDRAALGDLFTALVDEHGRLDAVVNVAGISRPTGFASGTDEDWDAVLAVHLDGYRNVLDAALPLMVEAGAGRIVGVTSGAGWRAADAGAYSCAKRAVASLTWQLGRATPAGVAVNAISPIAMTRMVSAAMARARPAPADDAAPAGRASGGLSLRAMPEAEALAPLGAHLAAPDGTALRGRVLFAGGAEVATVIAPRLLEVVATPDAAAVLRDFPTVVDAWIAAEAGQATTGCSNPRFAAFETADVAPPGPVGAIGSDRHVLVVGDGEPAARTAARLRDLGAITTTAAGPGGGSDAARHLLDEVAAQHGALDAVVVEAVEPGSGTGGDGWAAIVADHAGLATRIAADARWARAGADHAARAGRPLRLVTLVDAATPAGASRAQAAAQLARAASGATGGRVSAAAVATEDRAARDQAGALGALLAVDARADGLAGAELAVGPGWTGLRSHPAPGGAVVARGAAVPPWLDAVVEAMSGTDAAP